MTLELLLIPTFAYLYLLYRHVKKQDMKNEQAIKEKIETMNAQSRLILEAKYILEHASKEN